MHDSLGQAYQMPGSANTCWIRRSIPVSDKQNQLCPHWRLFPRPSPAYQRRGVPIGELWERPARVQPRPHAARTIARMPALSASGRPGRAWATSTRSGSNGPFCAPSAPDSAPPWVALVEFPVDSCDSSSPVLAILHVHAETRRTLAAMVGGAAVAQLADAWALRSDDLIA